MYQSIIYILFLNPRYRTKRMSPAERYIVVHRGSIHTILLVSFFLSLRFSLSFFRRFCLGNFPLVTVKYTLFALCVFESICVIVNARAHLCAYLCVFPFSTFTAFVRIDALFISRLFSALSVISVVYYSGD